MYDNNDKESVLNERQLKLLDVITKQNVLQTSSFSVAIIVIILCVIMVGIDDIINENYDISLIVFGYR